LRKKDLKPLIGVDSTFLQQALIRRFEDDPGNARRSSDNLLHNLSSTRNSEELMNMNKETVTNQFTIELTNFSQEKCQEVESKILEALSQVVGEQLEQIEGGEISGTWTRGNDKVEVCYK
jgi:hypothetical protein